MESGLEDGDLVYMSAEVLRPHDHDQLTLSFCSLRKAVLARLILFHAVLPVDY